jgi:hypothetical protein
MREVERLLREVLDGSYECALPFAATVRSRSAPVPIDPTRSSPAVTPSPLSTTSDSAKVRPDAFLPSRRAWAVPLSVGGFVAAAGLAGAMWLRPTGPVPTAPSSGGLPASASAATAALVVTPPAIPRPEEAPSTASPPPSATTLAKPVAARLPASHAFAVIDAAAAVPSVASPATTSEPARRPGSVVDVPPF